MVALSLSRPTNLGEQEVIKEESKHRHLASQADTSAVNRGQILAYITGPALDRHFGHYSFLQSLY